MGLTDTPDFIQTTQQDILALFIKEYENAYFDITGQTITLLPAQAEQLLVNSGSYMTWLTLLKVQSAALQGLAQFAIYPVLDYIAQPFGVTRLAAQPATCTIRFTLVNGHGNLVIPAGTRVQTQDGQASFAVQKDIPVSAGVNAVSVIVVCDTPGTAANGYVPGVVNVILDPHAYLSGVVNLDTTAGGSDIETDEALRQRLYLSSAAFSTAGSDDSYKYHAKSANPLILDVTVNNGGGGVVNLYPLVAGGATPNVILAEVLAACSPKTVRPTSDTVNVYSPTVVSYNIDYDIVAYSFVADTTALTAQSKAAVQALADANGKKLGIDIIISQIVAAASIYGVAKVVVNSPVSDFVLNDTQVGFCTGVTARLTGINYDK